MNVLFAHLFVVCIPKVQVGKAAALLWAVLPVIDFALCTKSLAPEAQDAIANSSKAAHYYSDVCNGNNSTYYGAARTQKRCRERRSMAGARNARQRASLKSSPGTRAGKSSGATNATTTLEWMSYNPDTIIYELQNSLCGAVVAQPGRALDLFGVKLKTELS